VAVADDAEIVMPMDRTAPFTDRDQRLVRRLHGLQAPVLITGILLICSGLAFSIWSRLQYQPRQSLRQQLTSSPLSAKTTKLFLATAEHLELLHPDTALEQSLLRDLQETLSLLYHTTALSVRWGWGMTTSLFGGFLICLWGERRRLLVLIEKLRQRKN